MTLERNAEAMTPYGRPSADSLPFLSFTASWPRRGLQPTRHRWRLQIGLRPFPWGQRRFCAGPFASWLKRAAGRKDKSVSPATTTGVDLTLLLGTQDEATGPGLGSRVVSKFPALPYRPSAIEFAAVERKIEVCVQPRVIANQCIYTPSAVDPHATSAPSSQSSALDHVLHRHRPWVPNRCDPRAD